jgi:pimeloyl-ACP methyl ester carboxylesterase
MPRLETGLHLDRIPFVRHTPPGAAAAPPIVAFSGINALFRRLDRAAASADRYARAVARLLPPGRPFTLLGYEHNPSADFTLDTIADDFATILRHHHPGRATVLAVSFGGFVALRLAARHPDLLDKLILLVTAHRFSPDGRRRVDAQLAHLRRGDLRALARDNALLFRRPWLNALVRLKLFKDRRRPPTSYNDPAAIARAYEHLFPPGFERANEAAARHIKTPTLLLAGTRDQFFDQPALTETAALIPNARLHLYRNETHMLPVEHPRPVTRDIAAFLADPPPAPP